MEKIEFLDFSGIDLTDLMIEEICSSKYMRNLRCLLLNDCPKISFSCFKFLGETESLIFLESLELANSLKFE